MRGDTIRVRFHSFSDASVDSGIVNIDDISITGLSSGPPAPPTAVPTMAEWAMILFGMILAGGAAFLAERRGMTV